ncbi:hypothetical protein [Peptoniphilus asaccharolyticus]
MDLKEKIKAESNIKILNEYCCLKTAIDLFKKYNMQGQYQNNLLLEAYRSSVEDICLENVLKDNCTDNSKNEAN